MSNPVDSFGRRRTGARSSAAIAAVTACVARLAGAGAATASPPAGPYVSLGDSDTAAPLVPNPTGNPILCGRSTHNYPSELSRVIHPASSTDSSCSGAETADMTQPQSLEAGVQTNPPQFNTLRAGDALVTLGIGGNDAGLIGVAEECAKLDFSWPFGSRCRDHYNVGGGDANLVAIKATGPKVTATIQGIHQRAPQARMLVVSYPDGLPQDGSTCYPVVPLSVRYLNSLELALNAVIKRAARSSRATYVDTFTSSLRHDACQGANARVNGIISTSAAFPLHPTGPGSRTWPIRSWPTCNDHGA